MEILNHLLGTCGESHPNLFTIAYCVIAISLIKGVSFLYKKQSPIKN